ncbi:hypothetical protein Tco_0683433 [Tanacetum coccineum]|uniref:Reverse transcriptase domain-containing protein n=1 Tax=Tanacetum coccineum TaxID=301880 RepID=A0ABQ4XVW5_9ASTR
MRARSHSREQRHFHPPEDRQLLSNPRIGNTNFRMILLVEPMAALELCSIAPKHPRGVRGRHPYSLKLWQTNFGAEGHGSLNSAAGGNFLTNASRWFENHREQVQVLSTRAKAVVAKVSMNSSTQAVSSDVAELKDIVRALLLDKKNQASAPAPAPAPVKAVELSCVTCGGAHSHQNCPATHGNVYGTTLCNQLHRHQVNQSPSFIKPRSSDTQCHQDDLTTTSRYDAIIEKHGKINLQKLGLSMQNRNNKVENQMANLTDMLAKFVTANTASTSGSGTLPGNTITNPREDLKGITTRSGVAYQGPQIPTSSVVKANTRGDKGPSAPFLVTKYRTPGQPTDLLHILLGVIMKRSRNQANEQMDKFYEIFKEMSLRLALTWKIHSAIMIPIVATSSPTLNPFGDSDFLLLGRSRSFLGSSSDPDCQAFNPFYYGS